MPHLFFLDLRHNEIESLHDIISNLRPCGNLQHLYLEHSTRDNSTVDIDSRNFVSVVTADLKGLMTLDGKELPPQLTPSQLV